MRISKIKKDVKKIAKLYGLKYRKDLFDVIITLKKDIFILNYLTMCPVPPHTRFGKSVKERNKNFDKFLASDDLKKLMAGFGGCVTDKKKVGHYIKKTTSSKGKATLKKIHKKMKQNKIGNTILSRPLNQTQKKRLERILLHEWIHVLLTYNKISFQNIRKPLWKLDEGLTTYIETSFSKNQQDLEKIFRRQLKNCSASYKIYATNALKFNKILKDKKTPEERKKAILDYYAKRRKK